MKGDISGTRDGVPWPKRGEVAEVSAEEGAALIAQNMAEVVAELPQAEKRPAAKKAEKRA
jgi:hypothetical protein